jgi:drug/metabolite transporter (DMT)-like permease
MAESSGAELVAVEGRPKILNFIPSWLLLLFSIVVLSTVGPVFIIFRQIDIEQNPGEQHLSSSSIMITGSLVSGLVYMILFREQLKYAFCLTRREWGIMCSIGVCQVVFVQYFGLLALELIGDPVVTAMLGRLEPAITLSIQGLILNVFVSHGGYVAAALNFLGVVLGLYVLPLWFNPTQRLSFSEGEILCIISQVGQSIMTIMNQRLVKNSIPLGLFLVTRAFVGVIPFVILETALNGFQSVLNQFRPFIIAVMFLYSGVLMGAGGAVFWLGVKWTKPEVVSLIQSASFPSSLLMSFLIVGIVPGSAEWMGCACVIVGLVYFQVDLWRRRQNKEGNTDLEDAVVPDPTGDAEPMDPILDVSISDKLSRSVASKISLDDDYERNARSVHLREQLMGGITTAEETREEQRRSMRASMRVSAMTSVDVSVQKSVCKSVSFGNSLPGLV